MPNGRVTAGFQYDFVPDFGLINIEKSPASGKYKCPLCQRQLLSNRMAVFNSVVPSSLANFNLAYVSNDENEVADRSDKYKKVPDAMRVDKIFSMVENIKNHAQGVHQAAGCKPK